MEKLEAAEAQNRFDQIIERVAGGETILILRRGKPIARFRPPFAQDQVSIDAIAILEPISVELKASR